MAVEENQALPAEAMRDAAVPLWYYKHPAQRTDIVRGAQNVADQTGITQYIVSPDGYCYDRVTPDDERWKALGARTP